MYFTVPSIAFAPSWRPSFPLSSHERFGNDVSGCPTFFVSIFKAPFLIFCGEKEMLFSTGHCYYRPQLPTECNSPAKQILQYSQFFYLFMATFMSSSLWLQLGHSGSVQRILAGQTLVPPARDRPWSTKRWALGLVWSISLGEWSQGNLLFLCIRDLDESSVAICTIYVLYMPFGPSRSWAINGPNHSYWRVHARQQAKTMSCPKLFGAWSCIIQGHGHINLSIYTHLQEAGWHGRYPKTDTVFKQE